MKLKQLQLKWTKRGGAKVLGVGIALVLGSAASVYVKRAHAQQAPEGQPASPDQPSLEAPTGPWPMGPSPQSSQAAPPAVPRLVQPYAVPAGLNQNLGTFNNEPTIAVDPNNPTHLATATYLGIRVSTDGGLTFQPQVSVVAPAGYNTSFGGDSSLAYDSQGRLFWTFLLQQNGTNTVDVFVAQCNPTNGTILAGYPVNLSAQAGSGSPAHANDKDWLAADASATSPFRDQLYVIWTDFTSSGPVMRTSFSANQGLTWSGALAVSVSAEGYVWPSHITVAPNGDVYIAYHSQPGFVFSGWTPDGTSGQIIVLRSTNGGGSYPQRTSAFTGGNADITFNVQGASGTIPGTLFWLQGSAQPWVMADPITPGRIYVVANDDPDNNHGSGDDASVFITVSTNNGVNWSAPARVDDGPGTTFQVMPTAAIDAKGGCIAVHYYDNRRGLTNAAGNFLLDVFAQTSQDGGVTFGPAVRINDTPFDPDLNASCRWGPTNTGCGNAGPNNTTNRTLRIGEYNGVAVGGGAIFAVFTGNDPGGSQQTFFDELPCVPCVLTCPANLVGGNDPGLCGAVVTYPPPPATGGCGVISTTPASGSFFPVGTNTVTVTSAANGNCSFTITVKDIEPPKVTNSVARTLLWPPYHDLVNVGLTATATDNCDGALSVSVAVFGNEDDQVNTGDGIFSPDAKDIAPLTLRLREERRGDRAGRVYLIVCSARDKAGNVGFTACTVVVPHDLTPVAIAGVNAQAAAALAYCLANNGAPPPGYFVIGDGPIIGPKQ